MNTELDVVDKGGMMKFTVGGAGVVVIITVDECSINSLDEGEGEMVTCWHEFTLTISISFTVYSVCKICL